MPVGTVAAADCSLTVSPKSGAPGTEFVFKGKGFTPTTLTLTRGDEAARRSSPWAMAPSTPSSSASSPRTPTSGKWRAVADGCERHRQHPRDPAAHGDRPRPPQPTAAPTTRPQLAGMTLLGVLFLGATALLLPRLTRAARSR